MPAVKYYKFQKCEATHADGTRCTSNGIHRPFAGKVLCSKHYKEYRGRYFATFFSVTLIIVGLIINHFFL